jgi:hypothetical protein
MTTNKAKAGGEERQGIVTFREWFATINKDCDPCSTCMEAAFIAGRDFALEAAAKAVKDYKPQRVHGLVLSVSIEDLVAAILALKEGE